MEKKVYYCEICDKVSVKLSDRMAHDRNAGHISNCIEYRHSILNNPQQLKIMEHLLKDKLNFVPKSLDELTAGIVHILAKQHLTNQQISDIRKRKKASQTQTQLETQTQTQTQTQQ